MRKLLSCLLVVFLGTASTQTYAEKDSASNDTNFKNSLEVVDNYRSSETQIFAYSSVGHTQYFSEYSFSEIVPLSNTQALCAEKVCESIFIKNQFIKLALSNEVMCLV